MMSCSMSRRGALRASSRASGAACRCNRNVARRGIIDNGVGPNDRPNLTEEEHHADCIRGAGEYRRRGGCDDVIALRKNRQYQ